MRLKQPAISIATLGVLLFLCLAHAALGQQRRMGPGNVMEPFTCPTLDGADYHYDPGSRRLTILTFVSAYQKRSERALDDLLSLVASAREGEHPLEFLVIVSGDEADDFRPKREDDAPEVIVLRDERDALWGRLGVVVAPTTFVVDSEGVITWVRAGHSFDFAVEAEAALNSALGLQSGPDREDAPRVPPPTPPDRPELARKHLRMAQILARRGDLEAALDEGRRAAALTPEAPPVQLELARLLCLTDHPDEALALTQQIVADSDESRAKLLMLSGWAHRLEGELESALASLEESTALDPTSRRALYELGKVLEAKGECEAAMHAYRKALALVYATDPALAGNAPR
jgi:tetratricopeptide (TPR) repeat protein